MEININCDLGEKSKFHSIENDPELFNIVNSANMWPVVTMLVMRPTMEMISSRSLNKMVLVWVPILLLMTLKTLEEKE